ncbi:E3 SUMO-protein ligase RanBP2-like [Gastrophryne carolinensis]
MRRSKAELQKYIDNVQNSVSSPREKSMKGFLFAKLYYEAKEYDLAKRNVSSYINVQERDPKAHRFLGHLFEIEGNIENAVGCYKRSLELNPTQKDLVLKIAELVCTVNVTDGRAEYWLERAAKLFPGSPVIYKLKEKLLNTQGAAGWNQLFDLIQSELFARPNDVHVNIRLVELFRSGQRIDEAVIHCLKPERRPLRTHLEWCACVVDVLKEYVSSHIDASKSNWRTINKELLLAYADLVQVTLSTRNVQESRIALKSFDQALCSLKPHAGGTDDLSTAFIEMRGHYYMHAGTQLLKMAQAHEFQWKASLEPAALCYLLAFQVPWTKPVKGDENLQNIMEGLACDRQSQSGHLLLSLSHGKDHFLKDIMETFANPKGQTILLEYLFENDLPKDISFLGTDDISSINSQIPDVNELHRYDQGAVRVHNGDLQHLSWLGLQWHFMSSPINLRKWLKQLFPRLPHETSRIESNNPDSICVLDLEVFLLAVIYTSHLQLQSSSDTLKESHQPRCLPLPICKQLFTDKQRSWWNAVYSLIHKTAQPGSAAKLRLVIQHELNTLRALEKHGLQPALLIFWARSLYTTGISLNSFYDQRDYMVRCMHYWKKVLPLLEMVRQKKSIPEPVDPLFKHFHSTDIKVTEVRDLEDEAGILFAKIDMFDGKTDDAILAWEAIKNVDSYWNLALAYQRKAEDLENEGLASEEQEEYHNCMQKCKSYLIKILDDISAEPSLTAKLQVPIESVEDLLDEVRRNLNEAPETSSPSFRDTQSFMAASGIKHSTPSPTKFTRSPNKTPKSSSTPPKWAEDQKSLIEDLVQQVEALKKEVHELRMNNSNNNMSAQRWAEGFASETATDGYHMPQSYYDVPLTVSTTAHPPYYGQSPVYNPQQLLRPVTNVTPTKTSVYPVNRMATQQHMYAMHTPPVQNAPMCGAPLRFESPATNILSPQTDEYYNYSLSQNAANPPLPEPGYFTKAALGAQPAKSEFGKNSFVQPLQSEGAKTSHFTAPLQSTPAPFKFNSNFKSNDGDFTFTSSQGGTPANTTNNEYLLRLLTSDKPVNDQVVKPAAFEANTDSRNMFRFGDKNVINNFADSTHQTTSREKGGSAFVQGDGILGFQSSKSTFVPPTFVPPAKDEHNQSHESDAGSEYVAEEDGPHFEPVVPLPEKVEVKTGEEDEEEMFCQRSKLFRFDADTKEWKERGVGNIKILRHRVSGKIRLLMRREQVLKICANHYITTDMKLKPLATSDKSYVWHAYDYADEMPKMEQLAIRFKTAEEATRFKTKFEEAQKLLQATDANVDLTKPKTEQESVKKDFKAPQGFPFGFQFGLKQGEWQCETCNTKNNEKSAACVACQTPAFTFKKDALTRKPSSEQPVKKLEQWVCSKCSKVNNTTNNQCVHCLPSVQNNASSSGSTTKNISGFKNVPAIQSSSFGSAFLKKPGQWDCEACAVRNESSAAKCVACQTPNPSSSTQATPSVLSFKFVASESGSQKDLGSLFAKKEGQWDCSTCMIRNEASTSKCVACQSPNPLQMSNVMGTPAQVSSFSFKPQNESLEAKFSRKDGQWDCTVCLVRNDASASTCVACQATNPNAKSDPMKIDSKSAFKFGLKASSDSSGPPSTGFKSNFSGNDFKFGTAEEKPTFTFKAPSTNEETKTSKEGFSFTMPLSSSAFKFGTSEPTNTKQEKEIASVSKADLGEKDVSVDVGVKFEDDMQSDKMFTDTKNSISFADLAKSSEGFAFGIKDQGFKGFSAADGKSFASKTENVDHANVSAEQEGAEDFYKTDDRDDIHFEPVVRLPDKVDLVTGEEHEETLYSQRVKLYRFDTETSQWKERGVGTLKILKNEVNGKLRILMRREQVLKVCANHWITTTMNLKPLSGSDRAWIWMANDFSDGVRLEQLAAKFKTPEQAEEFKSRFEECQRLLLDIPLQTPHKLVDTGRTAHLIKKAEEMKSGLKDLRTFLTDQSKLPEEDASQNSPESLIKQTELTEPTYEWDTYDIRPASLEGNLDDSIYASPLSSSPDKGNLFRFGESTTGFNFSFQPVPSPAKSPTKLNQSRVSVGTEDESDVTQEEERDGQYFEPVVPLPDLVEVTSGEENEQTLFCNRAKLYRFDKSSNQWKERGIGDLKILQNFDNKTARLVMRRDQVLKLCANHRITPEIHLEPMKGAERAWVWTALDYSEGESKMELFAVRFKLQEVADLFKEVFEEAKFAQSKDSLLTPYSARVSTPKASPCGKAAIAILEETTKETTPLLAVTTPVSTSKSDDVGSLDKSKTVVSPPKFVFGTDVVKNIFGTEKKAFTFGNSSGTGALFGFSFNASNEEKVKPASANQDSKSFSDTEDIPTVSSSTELSTEQLAMPSRGFDLSLFKSNPAAFWTCTTPTKLDMEAKGSLEADDVVVVYELTPTPEQRTLAKKLLLPPTFFCYKNKPGYVSDETDVDDEDFDTAVRKLHGQLYEDKFKGHASGISFSFGLNTGSGLSFADLASDNGDFAFGSKDSNFQWANTGAAVFSSRTASHKTEEGGDSDEEVQNEDVHFEPIVSLPEVDVKSGEEDEEILFKERTKLYRWDREVAQWKERGVGEIKILYHQERKYYRILMRRDQVLKVCANHVISKDIKLSPLNTSNNAYVWTANDYSEGEPKVEQFAARFKTQELADSFQKKFEECQKNLETTEP